MSEDRQYDQAIEGLVEFLRKDYGIQNPTPFVRDYLVYYLGSEDILYIAGRLCTTSDEEGTRMAIQNIIDPLTALAKCYEDRVKGPKALNALKAGIKFDKELETLVCPDTL